MSKKKKTEAIDVTPKPLDEYGEIQEIGPDDDYLDDLELDLMSACADWVDDHNLDQCFFTGLGEDTGEPQSLYAYLRSKIGDLRESLDESMQMGGCYVLVGGAR